MKRTWTEVGKKYTAGKEKELGEMFARMPWQEIPCSMGMAPGEGIKAAIKQLNIPKPSHVASSHELAPYGLLGVRGHYKDGMAEVFMVDTGTGIDPIASDFYTAEEEKEIVEKCRAVKKIFFQDDGQDILRWSINKDNVVVDCNMQGWVWNGAQIYMTVRSEDPFDIQPGDKLYFYNKAGVILQFIHLVEKVEVIPEEKPHG